MKIVCNLVGSQFDHLQFRKGIRRNYRCRRFDHLFSAIVSVELRYSTERLSPACTSWENEVVLFQQKNSIATMASRKDVMAEEKKEDESAAALHPVEPQPSSSLYISTSSSEWKNMQQDVASTKEQVKTLQKTVQDLQNNKTEIKDRDFSTRGQGLLSPGKTTKTVTQKQTSMWVSNG